MPDQTRDYLQKRAQELGLERADDLAKVQAWLDGAYPGKARAVSINKGVLKVVTPSASVASELRLSELKLKELSMEIVRVSIGLGTIR